MGPLIQHIGSGYGTQVGVGGNCLCLLNSLPSLALYFYIADSYPPVTFNTIFKRLIYLTYVCGDLFGFGFVLTGLYYIALAGLVLAILPRLILKFL